MSELEYSDRDWTEDWELDNGKYICRCFICGNTFFGHKRRVVCKVCAKPAGHVLVPRELLGDLGVLLDSLELFSTKLPPNAAEMIESARKKITTLLHP